MNHRPTAATRYAHLSLAQRTELQAMRSIVECIECECNPVQIFGQTWYDTRPMLNPHELPDSMLDINRELLDLACAHQLIARHPQQSHLVCVLFQAL